MAEGRIGSARFTRTRVPSIFRSWERDDFSLYGRFDLAYDGQSPPKLIEYNADIPTALVEASVTQWFARWTERSIEYYRATPLAACEVRAAFR